MQACFKRITLFSYKSEASVAATVKELYTYLQNQNFEVTIDEQTAERQQLTQVKTTNSSQLNCDLIISIGGDGSLLQAAHHALKNDIPLVGVHGGSLGFLTDLDPKNFVPLLELLSGKHQQEQRNLLHAKVIRNGSVHAETTALNDVVLVPSKVAHMCEFEISVDDEFFCDLRADGIIFATPTGSTAYALSAGGPIIPANLNAHLIVALAPHQLNMRPILIDSDSKITTTIGSQLQNGHSSNPGLSSDGSSCIDLLPGDTIEVTKYNKTLSLIHPESYNFYKTLRKKLQWGKNHNNA